MSSRALCVVPILCSWLVWVAPAAAAPDPLPFTSLTPADGTSFAKGQTGYPFPIELKADKELLYTRGEVSTSTLTGVDGSLADDFVVETFYLSESDAFPGTFSGNGGYTAPSLGGWKQTPGTYYWQFSMRCPYYQASCGGSGDVFTGDRIYLSPVRTITVTAPSTGTPPPGGGSPGGTTPPPDPPPMTDRAVKRYIRTMLRQNTNGRVRGLYWSCRSSGGPHAAVCNIQWRIGRFAYRGSGRFFHFVEGNQAYWDFSFRGKKKRIGCAACRWKTIRWT